MTMSVKCARTEIYSCVTPNSMSTEIIDYIEMMDLELKDENQFSCPFHRISSANATNNCTQLGHCLYEESLPWYRTLMNTFVVSLATIDKLNY